MPIQEYLLWMVAAFMAKYLSSDYAIVRIAE